MAEDITLQLTADEALVTFDWLARMSDADALASLVSHPGERTALDNLLCLLERAVSQVLDPRYGDLVAEARERLTSA